MISHDLRQGCRSDFGSRRFVGRSRSRRSRHGCRSRHNRRCGSRRSDGNHRSRSGLGGLDRLGRLHLDGLHLDGLHLDGLHRLGRLASQLLEDERELRATHGFLGLLHHVQLNQLAGLQVGLDALADGQLTHALIESDRGGDGELPARIPNVLRGSANMTPFTLLRLGILHTLSLPFCLVYFIFTESFSDHEYFQHLKYYTMIVESQAAIQKSFQNLLLDKQIYCDTL